ncbi:hypothetical protein [Actinospica robiniae]|uniref:hypothetical protein n=1 Tax=Actinospica robiniae TaxID=304901 RepID=UPI000554BB3D|nr:hypothetical protein [Actinospica robiniae]
MNPPARPNHTQTPENRVTSTMFRPPHLILINALYAHGWESTGPEPSALITGLTSITFTAPVGELAVRIEAVGATSMLTLTGNAPYGPDTCVCWRAISPVLPIDVVEQIARAGEDARRNAEACTEVAELIADLEARGWIHTEEHSHDELLGAQLASPDDAARITWGPEEDEFHITDRRTHHTITADYATPLRVLRVMAGIDTSPRETPEHAAHSTGVLHLARAFGAAAQRLNQAVLARPATGASPSAGRVGWSATAFTEQECDELLNLLADAANHIAHALTYAMTTFATHGTREATAEALSSTRHILNHAASILRAVTAADDEESTEDPREAP